MIDGVDSGRRQQASESGRLDQKSVAAFRAAEASGDPNVRAERLEAAQAYAGDSALAAAYTYLQRAVGVIAVLLPLTVAVGSFLLDGKDLKGSISSYYYTPMGNVFVGSLCALAVFFLSYNYRPLPTFELDNTLSQLASVAALGVAFFPTTSEKATASGSENVVAVVHLLCAGALFFLLAIFSLFLFTKTDGAETMTAAKKRRNLLYRTCGGIMVASILLVMVSNLVKPPSSWHALFWLETIMVIAFGVSWLVKGGFLGILADPNPTASGPASGPDRIALVDP